VFRNPWQIQAWHNREYCTGTSVGGRPYTYMRGGHLATVRSLRDGRVQQVADWLIKMCLDL
jgi:hypothetical protein